MLGCGWKSVLQLLLLACIILNTCCRYIIMGNKALTYSDLKKLMGPLPKPWVQYPEHIFPTPRPFNPELESRYMRESEEVDQSNCRNPDYPFQYYNGNFCCKHSVELDGGTNNCEGRILSLSSKCCYNHDYCCVATDHHLCNGKPLCD